MKFLKVIQLVFGCLFASTALMGQIQDTFYRADFYTKSTLYLESDGSFVLKLKGHGMQFIRAYRLEVKGDYKFNKANTILLNPTEVLEEDKNKVAKKMADISDISRYAEVNLLLYFIEFNGYKILLNEKNSVVLANLLNSENQSVLLPETIHRNNADFTQPFVDKQIKQNFPSKYKNYILDQPIVCQFLRSDTITDHSNQHRKPKISTTTYFDKGEKDGLLIGMRLYKNENGFYIPNCDIEIKTLTETTTSTERRLQKRCTSGTYSTQKFQLAAEATSTYRTNIHNAKFYCSEKKYKKAFDHYEEAFKEYGKNGMDYFDAAVIAIQLENLEKANTLLRHGIKNNFLDEDHLLNHNNLAPLRQSTYWDGISELMIEEKIRFLKQFEKIKSVPFKLLIPFNENDKWGYFSKSNSEVLIPAIFEKVSMGIDCLKIEISIGNEIFLYPDFSIKQFHDNTQYEKPNKRTYPKVVDHLSQGGFSVKDKTITTVSNIYDVVSFTHGDNNYENVVRIKGPYLINNRNYACVSKGEKAGIVDEQGQALKGFEFNFLKLVIVRQYTEKGQWFYFVDLENNHGFINEKGEKRFVNEFDSYPFTSLNKVGFGILSKRKSPNKFHFIDFTTMELLQENIPFTFYRFDAQYKKCDLNWDEKDMRENLVKLYFVVYDKAGNLFYMDGLNELRKKK